MTDIIIPKRPSLIHSKDMVGHLTIDIHNTRSGFTERYEEHNTVTDAANEYMWLNYLAYLHNGSANRPSNLYQGIFGGVCLFEDSIDGGNMLPLGKNHLVGYAGSSTSVNGNRGVYNSSESSLSGGYSSMVWDWGTSQANGTIGAVARTHVNVGNGQFSFQNGGSGTLWQFRPQDATSTYYTLVGIDKTNNRAYFWRQSNSTYYYCDWTDEITVKDGALNTLYYPREASMMTAICTSALTSEYYSRWLDLDNSMIRAAVVTTSGTSSDGVVTFYEVDLTAGSPSETTRTVTMSGCYLIASNTIYYNYPVMADGYLWVIGYDPDNTSRHGVYKMDISDNSTEFFGIYDAVADGGYTYAGIPRYINPWGTGGVSLMAYTYYNNTYYWKECLIDQDGNVLFNEPNEYSGTSVNIFGYIPISRYGYDDGAMIKQTSYISDGGYKWDVQTSYEYMATYANLSSAVTKTSSETLKLTYTLSDS